MSLTFSELLLIPESLWKANHKHAIRDRIISKLKAFFPSASMELVISLSDITRSMDDLLSGIGETEADLFKSALNKAATARRDSESVPLGAAGGTDFVSQADFDELKKSFNAMSENLSQVLAVVSGLSSQLSNLVSKPPGQGSPASTDPLYSRQAVEAEGAASGGMEKGEKASALDKELATLAPVLSRMPDNDDYSGTAPRARAPRTARSGSGSRPKQVVADPPPRHETDEAYGPSDLADYRPPTFGESLPPNVTARRGRPQGRVERSPWTGNGLPASTPLPDRDARPTGFSGQPSPVHARPSVGSGRFSSASTDGPQNGPCVSDSPRGSDRDHVPKLEAFDAKGVRWLTFIRNFEDHARDCDWSLEEMGRKFPRFLKGTAADCYALLDRNRSREYQYARDRLAARFGRQEPESVLRLQLAKEGQKAEESLFEYYERFYNLVYAAYGGREAHINEFGVESFLQGVRDVNAAHFASLEMDRSGNKNLEEAFDMVNDYIQRQRGLARDRSVTHSVRAVSPGLKVTFEDQCQPPDLTAPDHDWKVAMSRQMEELTMVIEQLPQQLAASREAGRMGRRFRSPSPVPK